MTRDEFNRLPQLVTLRHIEALGYGRATVIKLCDCGVLNAVKLRGDHRTRYQKRQVAALVKWEDPAPAAQFALEKPLMETKAVQRWTGWDRGTLSQLVESGSLTLMKPPSAGKGKYLKEEIAAIIGL